MIIITVIITIVPQSSLHPFPSLSLVPILHFQSANRLNQHHLQPFSSLVFIIIHHNFQSANCLNLHLFFTVFLFYHNSSNQLHLQWSSVSSRLCYDDTDWIFNHLREGLGVQIFQKCRYWQNWFDFRTPQPPLPCVLYNTNCIIHNPLIVECSGL